MAFACEATLFEKLSRIIEHYITTTRTLVDQLREELQQQCHDRSPGEELVADEQLLLQATAGRAAKHFLQRRVQAGRQADCKMPSPRACHSNPIGNQN